MVRQYLEKPNHVKRPASLLKVNRSNNATLKSIPLKGKNFGLTKLEYDELVTSLKEGKEDLFEKIFLSHFDNCKKFLITNQRASQELAYDITMDTLIQFRQRIITNKTTYGNLRYLFTVMATQNLIKHHQKSKKLDFSNFHIEGSPPKSEAVYDALQYAWDTLEKESKSVLEEYYYKKTPLIKIANKLGISDSTMRKKKQRCLEKLRSLFMNKYNPSNEE